MALHALKVNSGQEVNACTLMSMTTASYLATAGLENLVKSADMKRRLREDLTKAQDYFRREILRDKARRKELAKQDSMQVGFKEESLVREGLMPSEAAKIFREEAFNASSMVAEIVNLNNPSPLKMTATHNEWGKLKMELLKYNDADDDIKPYLAGELILKLSAHGVEDETVTAALCSSEAIDIVGLSKLHLLDDVRDALTLDEVLESKACLAILGGHTYAIGKSGTYYYIYDSLIGQVRYTNDREEMIVHLRSKLGVSFGETMLYPLIFERRPLMESEKGAGISDVQISAGAAAESDLALAFFEAYPDARARRRAFADVVKDPKRFDSFFPGYGIHRAELEETLEDGLVSPDAEKLLSGMLSAKQ